MSTKKKAAPKIPVDAAKINDFPNIEQARVISDAEALATLNDEDVNPTVAEARVMFDERPGLAQVLTDEGLLNRDGSFAAPAAPKRLTLDGRYVEVAE